MKFLQRSLLLVAVCSAVSSCDPYKRDGEYYAGPVDPQNFPADYIGAPVQAADARTGGNRLRVGASVFIGNRGFVGGAPVGYYLFSFPSSPPVAADPLRLVGPVAGFPQGKLLSDAFNPNNPIAPTVYSFDNATGCDLPHSTYTYDPFRPFSVGDYGSSDADGVNYSQQGNVFTILPNVASPDATQPIPGRPTQTGFAPVVAEARVTTRGKCQRIKSERTLLSDQTPQPTGNFLAWAIIDPSAAVFLYNGAPSAAQLPTLRGGNPPSGIGLQKWGWFNHYMLAYLDGGPIPIDNGGPPSNPESIRRMRPQQLFIPNAVLSSPVAGCGAATCGAGQVCTGPATARVCADCNSTTAACGAGFTCNNPGTPGAFCYGPPTLSGGATGYAVLQSRRTDPAYSPVCQVNVYYPATPPAPAAILTSETAIRALGRPILDPTVPNGTSPLPQMSCPAGSPAGSLCPIPRFVFCLQLP